MTPRLVHVEWEDASRSDDWKTIGDLDDNPPVCVSVGHLVRVGPKSITLALTKGKDDDGIVCHMDILRVSIVRITELKEGPEITLPLPSPE